MAFRIRTAIFVVEGCLRREGCVVHHHNSHSTVYHFHSSFFAIPVGYVANAAALHLCCGILLVATTLIFHHDVGIVCAHTGT
jgi:thiosulfate reductase cytochrome b subunit